MSLSVSQPTVNLSFLSDHGFLQRLAGSLTSWKASYIFFPESKQKTILHMFWWEWLAQRNGNRVTRMNMIFIWYVCHNWNNTHTGSREGGIGLATDAANISISKDLPVAFWAQKLSFLNVTVSFQLAFWNKWREFILCDLLFSKLALLEIECTTFMYICTK